MESLETRSLSFFSNIESLFEKVEEKSNLMSINQSFYLLVFV